MTLLQTTPASPAAGAPPLSSPARDARMAPLAAEPPDAFALIEAAHAQIAKTLAAATGEFAARTFKHQSSMELAREIGVLTLSLARVAKMLEPPKEPRPSRRVSRFAERRAAHFAHFAEAEPPAPAAAQPPAEENCDFPPMRMWSGGKLYRDEEEFSNDYRAARRARVQEKATERAARDGIDYRAALDIEYAEWETTRRATTRASGASGETSSPTASVPTQIAPQSSPPGPVVGALDPELRLDKQKDAVEASGDAASPPSAEGRAANPASVCGNATEDPPSNVERAAPTAPIPMEGPATRDMELCKITGAPIDSLSAPHALDSARSGDSQACANTSTS